MTKLRWPEHKIIMHMGKKVYEDLKFYALTFVPQASFPKTNFKWQQKKDKSWKMDCSR